MATVQRFEDLLAWQKSRALVKNIYAQLKMCQDHGFNAQLDQEEFDQYMKDILEKGTSSLTKKLGL